MKITILKEKLKSGVNVVDRIVGKSISLPVLNNILIKAEKNFLNLASTDLEIGINWWSLVKTEKEGKIIIPSKILANFLNFLPEKPIKLEVKDLNLKIESENYQTIIKGVNPEDFPIIPKIIEEESISINNQIFCQGLKQVADFASYSTTKPEISGVYLLFQKNYITIAATDSFRLGEKKLFLKPALSNLSKDYSLILPQRAAKEFINIFEEKKGEVNIYFSPSQILFETLLEETNHPQIQLVSRLIEGDFPNYQEIIPKKHETQITVPKNELINQIKLSALFSGKISEIKIKISPKQNRMDLYSQNPELGEHHGFLNGKVEGKPVEIAFNYRFLADGLLNIKGPEVVLKLTGPDKPCIIGSKGDDSYLYLVMPIKAS